MADYDFNDVAIVDDRGNVEYVKMGDYDFFQVDQNALVGTKVTQWYQNRNDTTSTLMQAVNNGTESLNYVDYLTTHTGRMVRQYSDTLCIKDGDKIIGAVEFAWYDSKKDIVFEPKADSRTENTADIGIHDYIGSSRYIACIKSKINKVADIRTPIFITGKTGTGKETLARIIHNSGTRANGEFVYVNCGALPANLLESILFGTAKGSFTGSTDMEGLFQTADGGTLFLDELNSMPLEIQGKLLKAIEEKRIRKVGDDKDKAVDARIITSCNESTSDIIENKLLRADLFFRISSIQFELPQLQDRAEDIPALCDYFTDKFCKKYSKGNMRISNGAKAILVRYNWPGNVRELRNVMEHAVYRTDGSIIEADTITGSLQLPAAEIPADRNELWNSFQNSNHDLKTYMRNVEAEIITETLEDCGGSLRDAARRLGITRQSLKQRLVRLNIDCKT